MSHGLVFLVNCNPIKPLLLVGKGETTWDHAQGVDPSSLDNMGTLERLDDPIDTSTSIHEDCHERTHKERGTHLRMGQNGPRDMIYYGCVGLDGCTNSMEGNNETFECGFGKGNDTPKIQDVLHKYPLDLL